MENLSPEVSMNTINAEGKSDDGGNVEAIGGHRREGRHGLARKER
ncbi:hypothetical protein PFLU4_35840 [Pseudomonas fluorescens]|nr:hypothetical protein PFLU4_35840 [Pseudomonas fluorescens]